MRPLTLALAIALTTTTLAAQDWRGNLDMIDNDLRTQHYAHARKWSIKMINSMCDHLGTGSDSMYTLAMTVAYRAMAEAGLKKTADADWYSHVAFSLYPKLTERDWSAYGEVGEWLTSRQHEAEAQIAEDAPAPIPIRRNEPKCPLSAIAGGYYQSVTVGAIVDGDGNARCPRLVSKTVAPTLVYAAFESLKDFQFEPGTPAKYEVTVHFNPPHP
jgi:hypothetical protein